jgi:hypothetical protein
VSQCSTLFAMRMANDRDQEIVRSAVSDAAAGLLAFVPALGTREVFAFGEGVALPTRLRFGELPPELLPRSSTAGQEDTTAGRRVDTGMVATVVERWRRASMSHGHRDPMTDEDGFNRSGVKVAPEKADADREADEPNRVPRKPNRPVDLEPPRVPSGDGGGLRWRHG